MYTDGKKVDSDYNYVGLYIQNWSTGTKAAMYRFEAVDKDSGAPAYIVFNDHMIEQAAAAHFHLKMSNESFMRLSTRKIPGPRSSRPI